MTYITFDYSKAIPHLGSYEVEFLKSSVRAIHKQMHSDQSIHRDTLGWINYPEPFDRAEFTRIQQTVQLIQETSDILLVIGMDGSYLGARAAIDMLTHAFKTSLHDSEKDKPQIIFVPRQLTQTYMQQVKDGLKGRNFAIHIVCEAESTKETSAAFRYFYQMLKDKYGKTDAKERIHTTTHVDNAISHSTKFNRRHLVLTTAGLLSMAVAGVDIDQLMKGAHLAQQELVSPSLSENSAYEYAVVRHLLSGEGMAVEWLALSNPRMQGFGEWRRWLFGNDGNGMDIRSGLYPSFSTCKKEYEILLGYMEDGHRDLVITDLTVNGVTGIPSIISDRMQNVPKIVIEVPELDAYTFGYLLYFFKKASVMDGYLNEMVVGK